MRIGSLIYTTSNGKEFGFHTGNIHYVMSSFDNRSVMNINVSDIGSYIVSNTSISNNKSIQRIFQEHNC